MRILKGRSANQWAEQASEIANANGHGAYSFELHGGRVILLNSVDSKRAEARTTEETRGAQIVAEAAKAVFARGEHPVDERAIWSSSSHHQEVARAFPLRCLECYLPGWN